MSNKQLYTNTETSIQNQSLLPAHNEFPSQQHHTPPNAPLHPELSPPASSLLETIPPKAYDLDSHRNPIVYVRWLHMADYQRCHGGHLLANQNDSTMMSHTPTHPRPQLSTTTTYFRFLYDHRLPRNLLAPPSPPLSAPNRDSIGQHHQPFNAIGPGGRLQCSGIRAGPGVLSGPSLTGMTGFPGLNVVGQLPGVGHILRDHH